MLYMCSRSKGLLGLLLKELLIGCISIQCRKTKPKEIVQATSEKNRKSGAGENSR